MNYEIKVAEAIEHPGDGPLICIQTIHTDDPELLVETISDIRGREWWPISNLIRFREEEKD